MSVPFTLHTAFGDRFSFDQPSSKIVLKNDKMIFVHILLLIFSFEAIKISVNAVKLWFVISYSFPWKPLISLHPGLFSNKK